MALTATQLVTVAEITQESLESVNDAISRLPNSSLTAEQITLIAADIITWNLNRDDVDVWLESTNGVNWQAPRLLSAIRMRVRKQLALPLESYEISGYSQNVGHTWIF